jgi:hypothetical protein
MDKLNIGKGNKRFVTIKAEKAAPKERNLSYNVFVNFALFVVRK